MQRSRVIIAGSRDFEDYSYLKGYLATLPPWLHITEVVCGMANGADLLGKKYAEQNGIPVKEFPADWARLGRKAGPMRNVEMGVYADGLIAFWDGQSKGTLHMITYMKEAGKWVYVVRTDIPWDKQFKTTIHNGKSYHAPKLNNVEYVQERTND